MKKILIVDDSPFFRGLLTESLKKEAVILPDKEVKIIEADDVTSTLVKMKDEKPDLVLLDIVMREGEEEGINILQQIRKLYPNQKIIMITSVGQTGIMTKCKSLGVLEYIEKPFSNNQISVILKKYCGT